MAEIIAFGVVKTPKGIETRKIQKSIEELKHSKDAMEKMCFHKKTPDGRDLEGCTYHSNISHHPVGDMQKYQWCLEGIKDYAFCTSDYQVYDLCNWMARKQEEKQQEYYRSLREKLNRYDHNMKVTYSMHDSFMTNFDKRQTFLQRKKDLEKTYDTSENKMEEQPDYLLLSQLVQKAEEIYDSTVKHLEAIYNAKPQEAPKDYFIRTLSEQELIKFQRAKAALDNWCNKFQQKPLTQEEATMLQLEKQIEHLTKLLQDSYETPCVYIHKAITSLDELHSFCKKDPRAEDTVYTIEEDLKRCEKMFKVYKEFIGSTPIENIIKKVEKEQRIASMEESKNKKVHFIQKLDTKQQGFVVKLDGSIAKDTSSEPKLIIGSAVTSGKIEDDVWRKLRT